MSDTSNIPDDGTEKPEGLGSEGTIPNEPGSVGVGAGEPTTFEPEEDPEAAARRDPEAAGGPGLADLGKGDGSGGGQGDGTSANDADASS
jgi:hypothetical protein